MKKKTEQMLIRLDSDLFGDLEKIQSEIGISKSEIARSALRAVCVSYEESGRLKIPFKIEYGTPHENNLYIQSYSEKSKGELAIAEDSTEYGDIEEKYFMESIEEINKSITQLAYKRAKQKKAKK